MSAQVLSFAGQVRAFKRAQRAASAGQRRFSPLRWWAGTVVKAQFALGALLLGAVSPVKAANDFTNGLIDWPDFEAELFFAVSVVLWGTAGLSFLEIPLSRAFAKSGIGRWRLGFLITTVSLLDKSTILLFVAGFLPWLVLERMDWSFLGAEGWIALGLVFATMAVLRELLRSVRINLMIAFGADSPAVAIAVFALFALVVIAGLPLAASMIRDQFTDRSIISWLDSWKTVAQLGTLLAALFLLTVTIYAGAWPRLSLTLARLARLWRWLVRTDGFAFGTYGEHPFSAAFRAQTLGLLRSHDLWASALKIVFLCVLPLPVGVAGASIALVSAGALFNLYGSYGSHYGVWLRCPRPLSDWTAALVATVLLRMAALQCVALAGLLVIAGASRGDLALVGFQGAVTAFAGVILGPYVSRLAITPMSANPLSGFQRGREGMQSTLHHLSGLAAALVAGASLALAGPAMSHPAAMIAAGGVALALVAIVRPWTGAWTPRLLDRFHQAFQV